MFKRFYLRLKNLLFPWRCPFCYRKMGKCPHFGFDKAKGKDFTVKLNRNQEIIISDDGISYGPRHEMTNEEKVVHVVGDRKGHVELFYDYHTSSWKSYLFDKWGDVIVCSTTEEDGHYTIDESLGALLLNINQKLQE